MHRFDVLALAPLPRLPARANHQNGNGFRSENPFVMGQEVALGLLEEEDRVGGSGNQDRPGLLWTTKIEGDTRLHRCWYA